MDFVAGTHLIFDIVDGLPIWGNNSRQASISVNTNWYRTNFQSLDSSCINHTLIHLTLFSDPITNVFSKYIRFITNFAFKRFKKKTDKKYGRSGKKMSQFFFINVYVKAMSTEKNWVTKKFNEGKKCPIHADNKNYCHSIIR